MTIYVAKEIISEPSQSSESPAKDHAQAHPSRTSSLASPEQNWSYPTETVSGHSPATFLMGWIGRPLMGLYNGISVMGFYGTIQWDIVIGFTGNCRPWDLMGWYMDWFNSGLS